MKGRFEGTSLRSTGTWLVFVLAVVALNVTTLGWTQVGSAQAADLPTLTIYNTPALSQASLPWIIKGHGLDIQNGFQLNIVSHATSAVLGEGLASGNLPVVSIADSTTISLLTRGVPIKLVAPIVDSTRQIPLIAREELGIETPADLKGKTIGLPFGSGASTFLIAFMRAHGLTERDLNLIDLSPSDLVPAWVRGDIDAAVIWPPALVRMLNARPSVVLHDGYDSYFPGMKGPDHISTVYLVLAAREEFLADPRNREALKGWLRAHVQAVERLQDPAFFQESVRIIAQATGLDAEVVEYGLNHWLVFSQRLDDVLSQSYHRISTEWYQEGVIPRPLADDLSQYYDLELICSVNPHFVTWRHGGC